MPANQRVGINIYYLSPITPEGGAMKVSNCKTRFSFEVDEGRQYEIKFGPTAEGCAAQVYELGEANNEVRRTRVSSVRKEECSFDK